MVIFTPAFAPDTLSQTLRQRAQETDDRLRQHPYFGRLYRGEASLEEYAAWLVQLNKYTRYAEMAYRGLQLALSARGEMSAVCQRLHDYAGWEAEEEAGHDELCVDDLSVLWGVSKADVRRRIEEAETAPSAQAFPRLITLALETQPEGLLGIAITLETLATLSSNTIRDALVDAGLIPSIEDAVTFLVAHSAEVETAHSQAAAEQADALVDPRTRAAVGFYGSAALAHFESLVEFIHMQLERELVLTA